MLSCEKKILKQTKKHIMYDRYVWTLNIAMLVYAEDNVTGCIKATLLCIGTGIEK